jgi:hypothetical protein
MIQAATIDAPIMRHVDPRNPDWWHGLDLVLGQIFRDSYARLVQLQYMTNSMMLSSCLATDRISNDAMKNCENNGKKIWDNLSNLLFPWITTKPSEEANRSLHESWERIWGRYDSPETQAAIQRTVEFLQSQRISTAQVQGGI